MIEDGCAVHCMNMFIKLCTWKGRHFSFKERLRHVNNQDRMRIKENTINDVQSKGWVDGQASLKTMVKYIE